MRNARPAALAVAMAAFPGVAGAGLIVETLDVSGAQTMDVRGSDQNHVIALQTDTPNLRLVGLDYDVTIRTFGNSWLNEVSIRISNSDDDGVTIRPGATHPHPSADGTRFVRPAALDLELYGLDFNVLEDGMLYIEFFETVNDIVDGPDAEFLATSTLSLIFIPAPGTAGLLALASLAAVRRRR